MNRIQKDTDRPEKLENILKECDDGEEKKHDRLDDDYVHVEYCATDSQPSKSRNFLNNISYAVPSKLKIKRHLTIPCSLFFDVTQQSLQASSKAILFLGNQLGETMIPTRKLHYRLRR